MQSRLKMLPRCSLVILNSTCMFSHLLLLDYHCGSMKGWSAVFRFKTLPEGTNWIPRLCLYGDLGNSNAKSLGYIQEELARDDFDAILHVGKLTI